nr:hypothetical protein GCM10020093_044380 [Planobispora longispora]
MKLWRSDPVERTELAEPIEPAEPAGRRSGRVETVRDRGRGALVPARLGWTDLVRVGASGLRTRPGRVILSALGIAIGIATMVAVVGISSSSKARLLGELDRLGTDLLTVSPARPSSARTPSSRRSRS